MIDFNLMEERIKENIQSSVDFLLQLINTPSPSTKEEHTIRLIQKAFSDLGLIASQVPLSDDIKRHTDYCYVVDAEYEGRNNLVVYIPGKSSRKVVINTHTDTVPPSGELGGYRAVLKDGMVYGRGACDTKGQVATIYLAVKTMMSMGIRPECGVELHFAVEEEVGGNGTLWVTRGMNDVDSAIVMEPTSMRILTAARGAVWFRITAFGQPGHSGKADESVSALEGVRGIMDCLEKLHADILETSKGIEPFETFANPMPLNFGMLNAGSWPATVPGVAVLQGVFAFLPNNTSESIMEAITKELDKSGFCGKYQIEFPFRRDCAVSGIGTPVVEKMQKSFDFCSMSSKMSAFPACCDAWFYASKGIETIIFGPGNLEQAHSDNEYIAIDEIRRAAGVLIHYLA